MACSAFKLQDMCLKGIPLDVILLNIAAATTILRLRMFRDMPQAGWRKTQDLTPGIDGSIINFWMSAAT
ncbi:hypothetical protein RRG08_024324 [Elysia crispata]|uniref:Uncharacterized protein n=1 Tax=Elysia crispata TaxID=231223 RepID=A0AAE0ZEQ1_9GAST|nr:hypothetical protein RRG08_024324 [Elysia crispata]